MSNEDTMTSEKTTDPPLRPWEIGPMRDVVQQTTLRATTKSDNHSWPDGVPHTVWTYVLSCKHTIEFPMPNRVKCACTVCADEMRGAAA